MTLCPILIMHQLLLTCQDGSKRGEISISAKGQPQGRTRPLDFRPFRSDSPFLSQPMPLLPRTCCCCCRLLQFSLLLALIQPSTGFGFENAGASCSSNEYCPLGWSVLRRQHDYSAHTCNPAERERAKCPKPYMCVAAKCGISFCCASDKMLAKVREKESEERDTRSAEREEQKDMNKNDQPIGGGAEDL